jgi:hypothetical protein
VSIKSGIDETDVFGMLGDAQASVINFQNLVMGATAGFFARVAGRC